MVFTSSVLAFAATALFSAVTAQVYPPFDPNSISLGVRTTWCLNQQSACNLLCLDQKSGSQYSNGCDPATLDYACVCADGKIPNATQYSQTIPYFICQTQVDNCVTNCQSESGCVTACRDNKPCGATNPTRVNATTITTSTQTGTDLPTGTGASGDVVYTGFGDGVATTTGASSSAASDVPLAPGAGTPNSSAMLKATMFGETYGALIMLGSMICSTFVFLL